MPLDVASAFAGGVTEHEVEARDARALVRALDARFPGIADRLGRGTALAVDGEIYQDWFLEEVRPDSDVRFLPAIEGG